MTFVNGSLLALGSLLLGVPILLHLLMRRKPSRQVFPAMRFLVKRHSANTRRLRLRHWLLLALRCAAILLLAAALARPSVASGMIGNWLVVGFLGVLLAIVLCVLALTISQSKGKLLTGGLGVLALLLGMAETYSVTKAIHQGGSVLLGDREAPVAAAIVIDTSPRMQYRHQNETRLEKAQRMASWLIRQLPNDSELAVLDSRRTGGGFSVDLGAAVTAVEGIQIANASLYVFTDLTSPSWPQESGAKLRQLLESMPDVLFYVIDVGVAETTNRFINTLQLSSEQLSNNATLTVQAEVANQRADSTSPIQLVMLQPSDQPPVRIDGELPPPVTTVRGRDTLQIPDGGTQWASFSVAGLTAGTHHGYVELEAADNLAFDNRRFFTVEVRRPWSILLVGSKTDSTDDLGEALAPSLLRQQGQARYDVTSIRQTDLAGQNLSRFDAVCLVDPKPLADSDWISLQRFVSNGGGIAIFAGRNASPASEFNSESARTVLPAGLKRAWRVPDGTNLAPTNFDHPILSAFRDIATTVPWDLLPVFRHWSLEDLTPDSRIVAAYGNGQPALAERIIGDGRVVLFTTPVSDVGTDKPWNYLINNEEPWPFVMLADRTMMYLVQSEGGRLNYEVGQPVRINVGDKGVAKRFQLFTPSGDWQDVNSVQGAVQFGFTDTQGTYQLYESGNAGSQGFSVNLPGSASNLDRLDEGRLGEILGPERYQMATDQEQIVRGIDQARIGREFYPFLMIVLALVLATEQLLANRFYTKVPST